MASNFEHTLRSLESARAWGLGLLPAPLLLAAWGAWMVCAEVSVYASAPGARVEVLRVPSSVASESAGRVARLGLELGAEVKRGQVLLELDGSVQQAEVERQLAALTTLEAKRHGVEALLRAEQAKRDARLRLGAVSRERAALGLAHARELVSHERELAHIVAELHAERVGSRMDALQADGKLLASRRAVADAAAEVERVSAEHDYQDKVHLATIAELRRQLVDLDAERIGIGAALDAAEAQLERLSVRAPVDGRVGNVAPLQVGDIVALGQVVASIVPPDEVRVVAYYAPSSAVGRVQPGQAARLRLDGFSWIEFGVVDAEVVRTASEPRAGLIRVELAPADAERLRIPLQHGLTGTLDICIEQASPWRLLQRSIGSNLAAPEVRTAAREPAP